MLYEVITKRQVGQDGVDHDLGHLIGGDDVGDVDPRFAMVADADFHLAVGDIVITSYSIHYTKLYDGKKTGDKGRALIARNGPERRPDSGGCRLQRQRRNEGESQCGAEGDDIERNEFAGGLEDRDVGNRTGDEQRRADRWGRITSYNVCYTKLLRSSEPPVYGYYGIESLDRTARERIIGTMTHSVQSIISFNR